MDKLNPDMHTTKELLYSQTDGKFHYKTDEIRSEAGGFISAAVASGGASATLSDLSSQLTDTRNVGGKMTGRGTLSSAGMKFLLKEYAIYATTAAVVTFFDGTTKKLVVPVGSLTSAVYGGGGAREKGLMGIVFSSDCKVGCTTGTVAVHAGGLRLLLKV